MVERVRVSGIGPVKEADIRFGDLTVFVGPQATGKSIILQLLKLLVDRPAIHEIMQRFGLESQKKIRGQHKDIGKFLDLYFGEGMESIWSDESRLLLGQGKNRPKCRLTPVRAGPLLRRRCFTFPRSGS